MIFMGTMTDGTKCHLCGTDLSNEFGVGCDMTAFCTACMDSEPGRLRSIVRKEFDKSW